MLPNEDLPLITLKSLEYRFGFRIEELGTDSRKDQNLSRT